jgi:hypothetical protein
LLVTIHPGIDGIGIAASQQSMLGDMSRLHAFRDFEQGRSSLAHVGTLVMISAMNEFLVVLRA